MHARNMVIRLVVCALLACGEPDRVPDARVPVGVLGDSDSHGYQDALAFPFPMRGGDHRATTFQWTEIWARLRAEEVDLGPWGTWGTGRRRARVQGWFGLMSRAPRKQDHEYNLAVSGAGCGHLVRGAGRQAPALVRLMDRDPERWGRGLVVIRIGINSVGRTEDLDAYAAHGLTEVARHRIAACLADIGAAVGLIRARHATTRIVLVGIADDANWVPSHDRWHDPAALANIDVVLDHFDQGLRDLAAGDSHIAFLDDRGWFTSLWGGRDPATGRPAYRPLDVGARVPLTNTAGDHPRHLVLADGHAGTVTNGLWLQELVRLVEATWHLGLTVPSGSEIVLLADPDGGMGFRGPAPEML